MKELVVTFLSGLVFAFGLGLSGLTKPSKVIGFLDVFGQWDPSLLFVMAGAIGTYSPIYFLTKRKLKKPVCGASFQTPTAKGIDPKLVVGAAVFGIGWGLSGICPGPAIVAVNSREAYVALFLVAMIVSIAAYDRYDRWRAERGVSDG